METEKRREEQRKFGVFFDDDYNYLQHLKEASGPSELVYSDRQPLSLQGEEEENEGGKTVHKDNPVSCCETCLTDLCTI